MDKNSFFVRPPFGQYKNYLIWFKFSVFLLIGITLILFFWSFDSYQKYHLLLVDKNILVASTSGFDEVVRKKNKLLALDSSQTKHVSKNRGVHAKIIDYLSQIESNLISGVQLNSFEYSVQKIEIAGYSCDIKSLSNTIENLDRLSFVKSHELQQISNGTRELVGKLVFTIVLNL